MAQRPPHSRPAHPHLAALPSLNEDLVPASGTVATPRALSSKLARSSARLQRVGSDGLASDAAESEPKDDPFHIGRTLAGRYRIEQLLGEGSMGAVVLAQHLGLDERVAVKLMRPELRRDPLAISRFAREAKALACLKSNHIPRLFDVGRSLGIGPYIVMEYLAGRDLGELLRAEGTLAVPRAVTYVLEACEALAVAHAAGITHQDLKPENLFLAQQGEVECVKLLDFGISKGSLEGRIFGEDLTRHSAAGGLMGTPLYMSPERVRNDTDIDHRSDIWSVGVVLHELVTGRTPFGGESVTEICAQVLEDAPVPLATEVLPPELEAVIRRCLSRHPDERFQTIGDLAAALLPLGTPRQPFFGRLSGEMPRISIAPSTPPARAEARLTPRPHLLGFALLAALGAAVLGVAFNLSERGSPRLAATPLQREDLAADTTFAGPASAAPEPLSVTLSTAIAERQRRPRSKQPPAPRAASIAPVNSSPAARPVAADELAPPVTGATLVPRVRLVEDRPRARLVEDNPPLSRTPGARRR